MRKSFLISNYKGSLINLSFLHTTFNPILSFFLWLYPPVVSNPPTPHQGNFSPTRVFEHLDVMRKTDHMVKMINQDGRVWASSPAGHCWPRSARVPYQVSLCSTSYSNIYQHKSFHILWLFYHRSDVHSLSQYLCHHYMVFLIKSVQLSEE